jgi:hypothetical protein
MHPQVELANLVTKGPFESTQTNDNAGNKAHGFSILAKSSYSIASHSILLQPKLSKQFATEVEVSCLTNNRDYLFMELC